jgi:geranylgeranyl diphosphate synthase type II
MANDTYSTFFIPLRAKKRNSISEPSDLKEYLNIIEKSINDFDFGHQPEILYDPIRYILSLGGKRVRPVLTLMACHLFDDDFQKAVYPALSLEIFHNFTLLHDDIMDKAPIRRGKPTVHEKWDENTALLSGDVMLIKAYDALLKADVPNISKIITKFNRCATGVCEGQQYDMHFETRPTVSEAEYIEMIKLKTAMLLAFSMELGAIIGGARDTVADQMYEFGINIGIGFQLRDDLLDVYADASKFGKQVGGDIISNKKTYLLIKALELADRDQHAALREWGQKKDFDPGEKVEAVKRIYDELNIKRICEDKMNDFFEKGLKIFDSIEVEEDRKRSLRALIAKLIDREN